MPRPQPKGGSRKGVPNKATKALKDMILAALDKAGGEDYLMRQAEENPGPFMALVGKVLPTQLTGKDDGPIAVEHRTAEEKADAARAMIDAVFAKKAEDKPNGLVH